MVAQHLFLEHKRATRRYWPQVPQGNAGANGADATINGVNAITLTTAICSCGSIYYLLLSRR